MKFVLILTTFLLYNLLVISQTKQTTTSAKSKTSKTTKSTNNRLKSVTNSHSGAGIENTGTTDIDIKANDSTHRKSGNNKAGTRTKTKSSGTKKKVQ